MKKLLLAFLLTVPMLFLSSCTVTSSRYSTSGVYTPAYYPGSPYYGSRSLTIGYYGAPSSYSWGNRGYWGNRSYWGNRNYYSSGYRGYGYGSWYGRRW